MNLKKEYQENKDTNKAKKYALLPAYTKKPPQALDLEEAVIGAILLQKNAITQVIDIVSAKSFYNERHQIIFEAILNLSTNLKPIDILTVSQELVKLKKLDAIGGYAYINILTSKVTSAAHIEYHARIVQQQFIKRELIRITALIQEKSFDESEDVDNLLDFAESELFSIAEGNIQKETLKIKGLISQAIEGIQEASKRENGLNGVPSGFTALDRITSGWQNSDLVILAARPSVGKCLGKGTKVLMYSGELKKVEDIQVGELLMGDDSMPRKILSLARGQEKMYWIKQNKAIDYKVNESHILSLKRSRNEGKHKHGDILNISVKDYLQKTDKFKSNYKAYKLSVEFPLKKINIDPYFLGLWLGDGNKRDVRISTQDKEIVSYLKKYAKRLNLTLTRSKDTTRCPMYAITGELGGSPKLSLQHQLKKLNLLQNKHIPKDFLINSTKNRLILLAGLIDSDGHYQKHCNGYEIVQKNKNLAEQIKFLCDSLGFRTSLNKKKASIKSINYECDVYRLLFFGDVDRIPVKIKRKKAKPWTCQRSWNQTGIIVEYDKVDDYYGFEIDGNHLFLLEDMTVTHNTAFSLSMLRNSAVEHGQGVAIFSLEMSSIQLVNRLIVSETELNAEKVKTGKLEAYEWEQLDKKIKALEDAPIFIDDTPALSVFELRAKSRRLKAQHDIKLIIIDYLQLMTAGTDNKHGNREQEVSIISRSLKGLAKELDIPIIALSQLNRSVEMRSGDKRPMLSDLRESGSIEQDADMVLFIHRPERYGITEDEEGNSTQGVAEIIIAKHRNGATGTVNLKFIDYLAKFSDADDDGLDSFIEIENNEANIGSKMNEEDGLQNIKNNGINNITNFEQEEDAPF